MASSSDLFVHARRIATDRTFFVSFTRAEVEAFGCGVCTGKNIACSYFEALVPDETAIKDGSFLPYAEFFVCAECHHSLQTCTAQELERLAGIAVGAAFRGADRPGKASLLAELRSRSRVPLTYVTNDVRFGNARGILPGTLGVSGCREDGTPRDCHQWLLSSQPIPLLAGDFTPALRFMQAFRQRYAYAIPSAQALEAIEAFATGGKIIEFGAGAGYWAFLLQHRGKITVDPVDVAPVESTRNAYWSHDDSVAPQSWCDVIEGQTSYIAQHSTGSTLLLIWPPEGSTMAADALRAHRGDHFIFIGHKNDDTGDADFFTLLDNEWELRQTVDIPTFYFMDSEGDKAYFYRRMHRVAG